MRAALQAVMLEILGGKLHIPTKHTPSTLPETSKMDGWKTSTFPFGSFLAYFQGSFAVVSPSFSQARSLVPNPGVDLLLDGL